MKHLRTWFRLWNGFALKGQHTRRIMGNLYLSLLMLIFLMVLTSGMMTDFGLAEGYHLLVVENVLGVLAIVVVLGMIETSLAERQGLVLNLAQSDLEQFHSSYGFGFMITAFLLFAIQVVAFFINGLFFDIWKSGQEVILFVMRCLSLYLMWVPMKYAKDFRIQSVGNGFMVAAILILSRVGNGFIGGTFAFWGIVLIGSFAFSYSLGRYWHCRHRKQKEK